MTQYIVICHEHTDCTVATNTAKSPNIYVWGLSVTRKNARGLQRLLFVDKPTKSIYIYRFVTLARLVSQSAIRFLATHPDFAPDVLAEVTADQLPTSTLAPIVDLRILFQFIFRWFGRGVPP